MDISSNRLYWQGDLVFVKYGYCLEFLNHERPLWWSNYFCTTSEDPETDPGTQLHAIQVSYHNEKFCIWNGYGYGWLKLIKGGSPTQGHFSLSDDKFTEDNFFKITEFDEKGFTSFLIKKDKWANQMHPEEYKKMIALRKAISNRNKSILS